VNRAPDTGILSFQVTRIHSPSLQQQPLTKEQDVFVTLQISFTNHLVDSPNYLVMVTLTGCFFASFDALSLQIYRSRSLALASLVVSRNVDMSMFSWFPISEHPPVNTNPSAQVPDPCQPRTLPQLVACTPNLDDYLILPIQNHRSLGDLLYLLVSISW
jgi:hypothetical protein